MVTRLVPENRTPVVRQGRRLQYLTIAWNSGECVVALIAGFIAGSIALVGFGFDSAIEVTSSIAALWRLSQDHDQQFRERAEQQTLRVIGVCFVLLAAYVLYEAVQSIILYQPPLHSLIGIVLAALSLIVMPYLAHLKRKVAVRLKVLPWKPRQGRRKLARIYLPFSWQDLA